MAHELSMGDDSILWVKFSGGLDREDVMAYMEDLTPFLEAVTETEPLHFLVEVSQMGKLSAAARKIFVEIFRDPDSRVGNTAVVGASRYVRVLAGFIIKATGRDDIRLFASEEEALAWLKTES